MGEFFVSVDVRVWMSLTCTHMLCVLFDAHTMCLDVIERVVCNIEVSRDTAVIV